RCQLLVVSVGARVLVACNVTHGDELVGEPAGLVRGRPAALGLERERVLLLAREAVSLCDVLAGLVPRLERELILEPQVRKAPTERRVPDGQVAARKGFVGL